MNIINLYKKFKPARINIDRNNKIMKQPCSIKTFHRKKMVANQHITKAGWQQDVFLKGNHSKANAEGGRAKASLNGFAFSCLLIESRDGARRASLGRESLGGGSSSEVFSWVFVNLW